MSSGLAGHGVAASAEPVEVRRLLRLPRADGMPARHERPEVAEARIAGRRHARVRRGRGVADQRGLVAGAAPLEREVGVARVRRAALAAAGPSPAGPYSPGAP